MVAARDLDDLRLCVAQVPYWWHSIDLGKGVVTPGVKTGPWLEAELSHMQLGDLRGKTVLDIGAYTATTRSRPNGWEPTASWRSIAGSGRSTCPAMRATASSASPTAGRSSRCRRCRSTGDPTSCRGTGRSTSLTARSPAAWRWSSAICSTAISSRTFDVVLYLGVLYRVRHPLLALERLVRVTRGEAIIETQAAAFRSHDRTPLTRFYEGDELNHDPSNWWTFNEPALLAMCRAAGFTRAETLSAPPRWKRRVGALLTRECGYRIFVRAGRA